MRKERKADMNTLEQEKSSLGKKLFVVSLVFSICVSLVTIYTQLDMGSFIRDVFTNKKDILSDTEIYTFAQKAFEGKPQKFRKNNNDYGLYPIEYDSKSRTAKGLLSIALGKSGEIFYYNVDFNTKEALIIESYIPDYRDPITQKTSWQFFEDKNSYLLYLHTAPQAAQDNPSQFTLQANKNEEYVLFKRNIKIRGSDASMPANIPGEETINVIKDVVNSIKIILEEKALL